MVGLHLRDIHQVHVVAAEDGDVHGPVVLEEVEVLQHAVGGAAVPLLAPPHLCGDDLHEGAGVGEVPRAVDVANQARRHVLRQDVDLAVPGVDEVGEDEVDDAIASADGHRRLGAVARQRREPRPPTASHDHGDGPGSVSLGDSGVAHDYPGRGGAKRRDSSPTEGLARMSRAGVARSTRKFRGARGRGAARVGSRAREEQDTVYSRKGESAREAGREHPGAGESEASPSPGRERNAERAPPFSRSAPLRFVARPSAKEPRSISSR